jgi:hypothetical protein
LPAKKRSFETGGRRAGPKAAFDAENVYQARLQAKRRIAAKNPLKKISE